MLKRFFRRMPERKRRGSLTIMAIPSSGGSPRSVSVPYAFLRFGIPVVIGVSTFFLVSYLQMSRGVMALQHAQSCTETTIEELTNENASLRKDRQEHARVIKELADKTQKLEIAVNQVDVERARIWDIVKGTSADGTAGSKASAGNTGPLRSETSRSAGPGANRGEPPPTQPREDEWTNADDEIIDDKAIEDNLALAGIALGRVEESLKKVASMQQDMSSLNTSAKKYRARLDATPAIAPAAGNITSGFGYRTHPILRTRALHEGVDISAPVGTPIVAAADGKVMKAGRDGSYGIMVEISHGFGMSTLYAHNSKNIVKAGDRVKRGQVIAYVGSTGLSTGPHVHYEVHLNGRVVDPVPYM